MKIGMSNENIYNEIIEEVYSNFLKNSIPHDRQENKEEFVNRIKTDKKFAEKWGLQIFDESLEEWYEFAEQNYNKFNWFSTGSLDEMVYNSNMAINWKKEMEIFKSKMDEGYKRRIRLVYNDDLFLIYE